MSDNKLPFDLQKSDLSYPKYTEGKYVPVTHTITLYRTAAAGWLVTTLGIGGSSRRSEYAQRTYAIDTKGKVWRVGKGPHVLETVTVYVTKPREKDLKEMMELYEKGLVEANGIRDRISSRRAQGQQYRAEGRTSWRW